MRWLLSEAAKGAARTHPPPFPYHASLDRVNSPADRTSGSAPRRARGGNPRRWIGGGALFGAGIALGLWLLGPIGAAERGPARLRSKIVSWDEAQVHAADWGEMRTYFRGQTAGTKDVFTAVAVVEPGKAVHKAHRHAEEEYLVVVHGSGTWSLDGKTSPATRGDILYVDPWVYHGLTNTGEGPLIFLVVKYSGKGVKAPPRPDDRPDEL